MIYKGHASSSCDSISTKKMSGSLLKGECPITFKENTGNLHVTAGVNTKKKVVRKLLASHEGPPSLGHLSRECLELYVSYRKSTST